MQDVSPCVKNSYFHSDCLYSVAAEPMGDWRAEGEISPQTSDTGKAPPTHPPQHILCLVSKFRYISRSISFIINNIQ
jgi:hypothetical protein